MAIDFSYPDWMRPKSEPWQAFVAGSQAGSQIAANRIHAKQAYANIQQNQQQLDLAEKKQTADNEAATLHNELLSQKLEHDAADFATARTWAETLGNASREERLALVPPVFHNPQMTEGAARTLSQLSVRESQLEWNQALDNAKKVMLKNEATVFSEYPDIAPDVMQYPPFSVERGKVVNLWLDKAREKSAERDVETYRQKQEILGTERENLETIRNQSREKIASLRSAGPGLVDALDANGNIVTRHLVDDNGKIIEGWTGVPTRYGFRALQVPQGKSAGLTPSQNLSRLRGMAQMAQSTIKLTDGDTSKEAKKENADAKIQLSKVRAELDALNSPAAPASAAAPSPAPRAVDTGTQHGPPAPKDYSGYGPPLIEKGTGKTWRLKPNGNAKNPADYEEVK